MLINKFPKYLFWSYKENADVPVNIIIQNVILYGDVKDMIVLTKLIDRKEIEKVIKKLSETKTKRKRINFFTKVIL